MKPYYQDDSCTIYHGDALELLQQIPERTAQLVATDPPYFRVIDEEWDDQWGADPAEFLRWLRKVLALMARPLDDRGTIGVFCSPDMACGVEMEMRRVFAVLNHIVWRKPGPGRLGNMEKESLRRFFPTSERLILAEQCRNPDGDLFRFRDHVNHSVARDVYADVRAMLVEARDRAGLTNRQVDEALGTSGMAGHYFGGSQWTLPTREAWEKIVALTDEPMPTWDVLRQEFDSRRQEFDSRRREFDSRRREFDSRRRERQLELLSDVWTFDPVPAAHRDGGHPTQKPIGLMVHIVTTMSRAGDLVLDPFMGSGSTLRAAKDLGRKAIGIEIDERYCEAAARRLSQEVFVF